MEFRKIKSLPNKPTFWLHKFFLKCIPHACGNLYDISLLRKGCPQKTAVFAPEKRLPQYVFSCQRSCWIRSADGIPIESLDVQRISEGLLVNKTTKELQDLLDLWGIRRASVDKICAVPTTGGFSDVLKETVCTSQEKLEKRNTMTRPKVKLNKRLRFFSQDLTRLLLARKLIQLPGVLDSARNRADLHSFCVKKAQTCDLQLANGTIKRGVSHNRSGRSHRQRHQEAASGTGILGCLDGVLVFTLVLLKNTSREPRP